MRSFDQRLKSTALCGSDAVGPAVLSLARACSVSKVHSEAQAIAQPLTRASKYTPSSSAPTANMSPRSMMIDFMHQLSGAHSAPGPGEYEAKRLFDGSQLDLGTIAAPATGAYGRSKRMSLCLFLA